MSFSLQARVMLIAIAILTCCLTVAAQTKIYIVGTVHDRTRNFTPDTIVNILTRLKPDLILVELDSSFFDENFNIKIRLKTNESLGIKKYISKHPTQLRPYDIKGRKLAKDAVKADDALLQRLNLIERRLDSVQRRTYRDFKMMNKLVYSFLDKKAFEINQVNTYDLAEKHQTLMYQGLLAIAESNREVEDLKMSYRQSCTFWQWRNERMVQNILSVFKMDTFKNKTIVLLTGFFHKYYQLNQLLPKQEAYGFVVKEYYD